MPAGVLRLQRLGEALGHHRLADEEVRPQALALARHGRIRHGADADEHCIRKLLAQAGHEGGAAAARQEDIHHGGIHALVAHGELGLLGAAHRHGLVAPAAEHLHEDLTAGGVVLHDDAELAEKHTLLPGLYLSVTLDALTPLLGNPDARLRFCLGYAGWGPHQLEQEMAQGSWLFTEAASAPVLELAPDGVWDSLVRQMGVDPAMLVMGKGLN